jgi:type I restriction enzyme, R subunit
MTGFAEDTVEEAGLGYFRALGYQTVLGPTIAPDADASERQSYGDVILSGRLRAAVAKLNPRLPEAARDDAIRQVLSASLPNLIAENRRLHALISDGVPVEFHGDDGVIKSDIVRLIEPTDVDANDWLAVSQFTVIEGRNNRRPDIVVFVNGLPLGVVELKNPGDKDATLEKAFAQFQTYKAEIPSLFRTNAVLVTSDGLQARIGSLTADAERFMPWRTENGRDIAPKGWPELPTLINGVFDKRRFLSLLRDFTVFGDTGDGIVKIIAGYHQFHAVRHAVEHTVEASRPDGDRKVGVIWHTQGSGKSFLMSFYAGQVVRHPAMANPTVVVITDRNDLDDQLFGTFALTKDLIRQTPLQAEDRDDLAKALDRAAGGVIFTTIQKFAPPQGESTYPVLTDRRNVIVIADEAHRTQYGFGAKVNAKSGGVSYGFAKYLRDALPNASFIGFTGTPVERDDRSTRSIFGEDIDVYDISRAVEDGATVPIYYESRLARIELPDTVKPAIDAEVADLTEDETTDAQEQLKRKWATIEALVGAEPRLKLIARDLVQHFEDRIAALEGKAMIVCMSRRICVALYNEIIALRPDWHSNDDDQGTVKIVMTGTATDPLEWRPHIGKKSRRDALAKRAKNPKDSLKLVIVRDMWLTGFDAPCMHTMYVDKPMQGHGLMQAIARVNRVFKDKPAGLIVDYIGIAQSLKNALGVYSGGDQEQVGIDEEQAVAVLVEKYEIVRDMFAPDTADGFNYRPALKCTPQERLILLGDTIEWILEMQQEAAAQEPSEEGKKAAHRRYDDAVLALSKAFALAAASDEAREIAEEVGFFQTVRAALTKANPRSGKSSAQRDLAVQQIVSRAVVSTEIVDILRAAGLQTPNIAILSDDFLAEVKGMEKRNLALEALRKLLADEITARSKSNVVQSKAFSERLEQAVARYHSNAITTVEVIQHLIDMAKDMSAALQRGEELNLNPEEAAFYDALAENDSARQVLGDEKLRVIAQVLLNRVRQNATVDWQHRETTRARLRVLVKRILREYGYPPDLQDAAVQTVLRQAEALSAAWTS